MILQSQKDLSLINFTQLYSFDHYDASSLWILGIIKNYIPIYHFFFNFSLVNLKKFTNDFVILIALGFYLLN